MKTITVRTLLVTLCLIVLTSTTALADGTTPIPDCPKGQTCFR